MVFARGIALSAMLAGALLQAIPAAASKENDSAIAADPGAIALYAPAIGAAPTAGSTEIWTRSAGQGRSVRNVTVPTLTPVLPAPGKANGAAVIVLPGGGFMSLALDHEGYRVAYALADRGITAFVLKYRLNPTPADAREAQVYIGKQMAAAFGTSAGPGSLYNPDSQRDAEAALAMVRRRSAEWDIDPARTGMIGFSAGARATLRVVLDSAPAGRPAFFGYIYGDMASKAVPAGAPPMFAAIAFDDMLYRKANLALAQDWFTAKRPVELHVYQKGGHGFGLGASGTTNSLMLDQFVAWLAMQRFLTPTDKK